MNPQVVIVAMIVVLAIAAAGTISYFSEYSGLRLEKIEPSVLHVKPFNESNMDLTLKSYADQKFDKIRIEIDVKDSSEKFLKPLVKNFDEIIEGVESSRNISMKVVDVKNSEGYEMHYDAEIVLFANETVQDVEPIEIIIEPTSSPSPVNPSNLPRDIKLENFNSENFVIRGEDDSQTIEFQVKSYENNKFEDIRIESTIQNSSGEFLRISDITSNETLNEKGDTTGFLSITIEVLGTEGHEIKYKVDLTLFSNNQMMDKKQIDVTIINE